MLAECKLREEIDRGQPEDREKHLRRILSEIQAILFKTSLPAARCLFEDVIGHHETKKILQTALILPITHPSLFQPPRTPPRALLLFGPPGTGKTLLARAAAGESRANFISVKPSDIMSKWLGDSETRVKEIFQQARENKPTILFIDEVEALCPSRIENEAVRRVVTQFLSEIDGATESLSDGTFLLAATNHPELLDGAMQRRFNRRVYVRLPSPEERAEMLRSMICQMHDLGESDLDWVVQHTERFSGSEVRNLVEDCTMAPVREISEATWFRVVGGRWRMCQASDEGAEPKRLSELPDGTVDVRKVNRSDFERGVRNIRPVTSEEQLKKYEDFCSN